MADLPAIRARLARYSEPVHRGNVTAAAYREDVGALLAEVERLRTLARAVSVAWNDNPHGNPCERLDQLETDIERALRACDSIGLDFAPHPGGAGG